MFKYYVSGTKKITPSTLLLTLKKDPLSKPFSFQPGQYTAISFERKGRPTPSRCFSIVNSPDEENVLQCSIRVKGKFTNAAAELKEGDEVKVQGSFGGFVFDAKIDSDVVLIAGGIGVAPFMSMIQYATNAHLTNKITLVYSCSDQNDVPFHNQLIELERQNPYFKIIFVISRGLTDNFKGQDVTTGRITPEIVDQVTNKTYDNKKFFICGPTLFMNAMTQILQKKGVQSGKIMTEAFSQGSSRQTGKIRSWPFNMYLLGSAGLILGSLAIMVNDLLTNLPSSSAKPTTCVASPINPTNIRQGELDDNLDELVYGFPTTVKTTTTKCAASGAAGSNTVQKCTTSQSGVTTCV